MKKKLILLLFVACQAVQLLTRTLFFPNKKVIHKKVFKIKIQNKKVLGGKLK